MKYLTGLLIHAIFMMVLLPGVYAADELPVLQTSTPQGTQIDIYSSLTPLQINQIHSWRLRILDADGNPQDAQITISGGMPEHDHGMPTVPQITQQLANGDYLLEGVRFHMPGLWLLVIDLTIDGNEQSATLEFRL